MSASRRIGRTAPTRTDVDFELIEFLRTVADQSTQSGERHTGPQLAPDQSLYSWEQKSHPLQLNRGSAAGRVGYSGATSNFPLE